MPTFAYTAIGRDGKKVSAREFADDRKGLEATLRRRHLALQDCREIAGRAVSLKVTVALVAQLSQLIGSGIVLDRALQIVAEDAENRQVARHAERLRQGVKRGLTLSQAVREAGRWDGLLAPLLRAGEASGKMAEVLGTLERYYEQRMRTRRAVMAGLAYPVVLIFANIVSLVGLGLYVIPVFKGLFEDRMNTLAASTRAVFWISDMLSAHGASAGAALLAAGAAIWLAARGNEAARFQLDRLQLALPLVGPLTGKLQAGSAMSVLSLLLESGVPLVTALEFACEAVINRPIRRALGEVLKDVRRGRRFGPVIAAVTTFPRTVHRFVTVGEETGRLGEMCGKAGQLMRDEADTELRALVTILEPVLILLMGGVVAFVMVSMLLAVYSISDIK